MNADEKDPIFLSRSPVDLALNRCICSRRCRQRANYADKVARGDFSTPYTGLPTTPHKSTSKINALHVAKTRPSPYTNAPLNILGGGSFRWPGTKRLDARTLENIRRSEIGAAP